MSRNRCFSFINEWTTSYKKTSYHHNNVMKLFKNTKVTQENIPAHVKLLRREIVQPLWSHTGNHRILSFILFLHATDLFFSCWVWIGEWIWNVLTNVIVSTVFKHTLMTRVLKRKVTESHAKSVPVFSSPDTHLKPKKMRILVKWIVK